MIKYIVIIIFIFLTSYIVGKTVLDSENNYKHCSVDEERYSLQFVRDTTKNIMRFCLLKDSIIIDNINIYNVDFSFDSLTFTEKTWHYVYKKIDNYPTYFIKGELKGFYNQILLQEFNQKIQLSYVSFFHYSYPNIHVDTIGIYRRKDYRIYTDKGNNKMYVKMNQLYKYTDSDSSCIDSLSTINYLNYDKNVGVYYSYKDVLQGDFFFEVRNKDKERITINNEKVFILEVGNLVYTYYKNNWYRIINTKPITLREFNSE